MVVTVYRGERGRFSFAPFRDGAADEIAVQVPEGSELLGSPLGPQLFVPIDRRVRRAWGPQEVLEAARERLRGFRVARHVEV